jgi:HK97 family phage major capsid protein
MERKVIEDLARGRHTTDEQLRAKSIVELRQDRAATIGLLSDLNNVGDRDENVRAAVKFVEDELTNLSKQIRGREDGLERDGEDARRKFNPGAKYETGSILRPDQSVRSYLQDHGHIKQADFADLRLGGLLRAMVTGARNDLERRALAEGSDNTGGVSVPDIVLARFIDALRANLVCVRLGAQTLPLTSDKSTIARTDSDAVAEWRLENAPIAIDDPTFSGVVLTPRSLAVIIKISRELLEDSVNVESALEASMRAPMAVEIDRVALRGSGVAPEPEGITEVATNEESLAGSMINDYDPFVNAMVKLWQDNSQNVTGIVLSPFNLGVVSKLKEGTTNAPLMKPPVLANIPMVQTTSMLDTLGIIGDFSKLIIGVRTSLRIEVLRELYAANHQYGFVAHLRADIGIEHPDSFCVLTNIGVS